MTISCSHSSQFFVWCFLVFCHKMLQYLPSWRWWRWWWWWWIVFCGMADQRKTFSLISSQDHSQRYLPSRIFGTPSRIWTCAEPEFRLCWMKFCSSDNHYTTAPLKDSCKRFLIFHSNYQGIPGYDSQLLVLIQALDVYVWDFLWGILLGNCCPSLLVDWIVGDSKLALMFIDSSTNVDVEVSLTSIFS